MDEILLDIVTTQESIQVLLIKNYKYGEVIWTIKVKKLGKPKGR